MFDSVGKTKKTPRQADAMLAALFCGWRWVSGFVPSGTGFDSSWLLPDGTHIHEVEPSQWEFLDDSREGFYTIRSLPAFTTDIRATSILMGRFDEFEVVRKRELFVARIWDGAREFVSQANAYEMAFSRAAYKAGKAGFRTCTYW